MEFGLYYHEIPSWQFIGRLSNSYQIDRIIIIKGCYVINTGNIYG